MNTPITRPTLKISREKCLSAMRRVIRERINFDDHPDDLVAWMTYSEQLFVSLPHFLRLLEEEFQQNAALEGASTKFDLGQLIKLQLIVRASILRLRQQRAFGSALEAIIEIHPSLIWDESEKERRPCRWVFRTPVNKFFREHKDVLDVHPIFQEWPTLALLLESYPTPSVHLPVGSGGLARHEVLAIYPAEAEIAHLQLSRSTSR